MISSFYKDYLDKLTVISILVDIILLMARSTVRPTTTKGKHGCQAQDGANKYVKKTESVKF